MQNSGMQRISLIHPRGADYTVTSRLVEPAHAAAEAATAADADPQADIFVIPPQLSQTPPQLVVMDVDSTFLNEEVIELIADHAGARETVARITDEAMRGELDFAASLRMRVAALAGVPQEVLDEVRQEVTVTAGVPEFVAAIQQAGGVFALVSGGFAEVVVPVAAELGVSEVLANRLAVRDGKLTGEVDGPIVDRRAKAEQLEVLCEQLGLDPDLTVAIGDGANDAELLERAAYGIAFCAKQVLVDAADAELTVRRMDAVWAALTGSALTGPVRTGPAVSDAT